MSMLRKMTIKQKLTAIMMLTSTVALLLALVGFLAWGYFDLRQDSLSHISTQAAIIAENTEAAVAFGDESSAKQILSALHSEEDIVFACIYDNEGRVFARYQRQDITEEIKPPKLQKEGHSFRHGHLSIFKQIILDGEKIGAIYLCSDLGRLRRDLSENLAITAIISILVFFIAYLQSWRLQRIISGPILSLAESATKIGGGELDHRVEIESKDEIGRLAASFNDMAGKLKDSYAGLEEKVRQRTEELSGTNVKLAEEIGERTQAQRELQERIKELGCLYNLSKLVEKPKTSLEQIFQGTPELIRNAYQHPDLTCVRITFEGIHYKTDNFRRTELSELADIKVRGEKAGDIEVYYLGEGPETGQSPFLKEDRDLLNAVAEHLGRIAERTQAREKLQLFRNLIDRSNDSVFVVEPKWGRLVDVNSRACDYLGYAREELLQMTIKDIDQNIPDDSAWSEFANDIREKTSVVLESLARRKDGTTSPIEVNINFASQEKGDYLIAVARDITERKKAEERIKQAAEEWMTTFNSITDLVSIHDKDCKLVKVNKAFADAIGMKPEEVVGKTCCEIIHGIKEPPAACPHKQTLETGKPQRAELFEPNLGIHLEVSTSPIFDENGEIIASAHIAKDITERKRAEERQAELLKEIEGINQELTDFAYIVSHDLKAPLRGIQHLVDWMSTDYADKLDEQGIEQMNLLSGRADRMHNLIDGVLQYSRVGRIKEKTVQVNLNELVPEIIDMLAPPENITITVENELPTVECEQTRIMQVFQNLLSNAVKYMDKPKGQIKVGCVEEDDFWKFSVADNGPGIEEKDCERIFQMFQTLVPRDKFESTGVGLAVVKKIIELYGGKIWVEAKPGQGSTFFFALPKQQKEMGVKNAKLKPNITR